MDQAEYITESQAKEELGNEAYKIVYRWLLDKGYLNFDTTDDVHYKRSDRFITRAQLKEFVAEQLQELKGGSTMGEMWGQTKEKLKQIKKVR